MKIKDHLLVDLRWIFFVFYQQFFRYNLEFTNCKQTVLWVVTNEHRHANTTTIKIDSISFTPKRSLILLCRNLVLLTLIPGNHWFILHYYSLPFLEFHINGIIQYTAFYVWLRSLSIICLQDSSMLARNINNLRCADDTTLMAESEEELKTLLMKVKEESEKAVLKLNIQRMKIMVSGPITLWQIDGEKWKQWQILFSWAPKKWLQGDCSHEIKRRLLLGRKTMTNLDSVLKSRDITLPTKVCILKAMVFPVVMYRCESWTIKKAEHQKIDALMLEKTLESPLDSKEIKLVNPKGNQPWIFTGRTDAVAEPPILCPPGTNSQLIKTDPDARKDWGQEERGMTGWVGWMASPTQWT